MTGTIRIGSRGSKLALWQTHHVRDRLAETHPGLHVEIVIVHTKGDKILDVPLAKIGDKGLFTKELERAILDGEVDIAVHSLKDLPTAIESGLCIAAVSSREDPRDAFVSRDGRSLADLPDGAVIGTSSLRRRSQLLRLRPGLLVADLRGNVDTRLKKVAESGDYDGALMARAGLVRLGYGERITETLNPSDILPAVGQGAMAIEARDGDERVADLLAPIHDGKAALETACERAFLRTLEGGCQVPVGAFARVDGDAVAFSGFVGDLSGKRTFRIDETYPAGDGADAIGGAAAQVLIGRGAGEVLAEIFESERKRT